MKKIETPDEWVQKTAKNALKGKHLSFLLFSEKGRELIRTHSKKKLQTIMDRVSEEGPKEE